MCAAFLLPTQKVLADPSLNQAAYKKGTESYLFGHRSIPNMKIIDAPFDTDWDRWAMLHDGSVYRLYFFKHGSSDTLYQFGFNRELSAYQYGYQSIPILRITGAPTDVDSSRFVMLHDGRDYRLYMPRRGVSSSLYQFAFNRASNDYEYGFNSIKELKIMGMPADADWRRIGMLHDGANYRFYAMKQGSDKQFYQAAFNRASNHYEYRFRSIPLLNLVGMPNNSNSQSFAMLHDGANYRFYFLSY
ncbi:MAG: hypothetical protein GQ569_13785 [Methylococcaceae bacterium]|nr:hypothetical protein [Methylococcaceae bacterium]